MAFRYRHGDRPLDGYTIQRGVGAGGFGEVYYAVSDGGRQVALKCLQYNQEIELRGVGQCMNLKSPHLVSIFDVKTGTDGAAFVIMEYVTGPSLREILRDAPNGQGPEKAAFFVREIGRGLAYLHERGIVHRDLKPENIFFEDGYVKIGDYGLSKYISVSQQSAQTISVGTVHYMAPEIGSGRYHRGIDIYALGIMAYEMLAGRVPFTGDSFGEILMKHLTVEPDLSAIPAPFLPILKKALAKSPEARYERVEAMVDDLAASPEIEGWLRSFKPESLTRAGRHPEAMETVVLGSPGAQRPAASPHGRPHGALAGPPPLPPPLAAAEARPNAGNGRGSPPPFPQASAPQKSFVFPSLQQIYLSLGIAASIAVVIALMGKGYPKPFFSFFGGILLTGAGALAVFLAERPPVARFVFEPGLPRRLVTVLTAAPLYFIIAGIFFSSSMPGTPIALTAATALIAWTERTRSPRNERIQFWPAFTAGLCGFILAAIMRGQIVLVAGVMAAVSLVVNALSPFVPLTGRRRASPPPREGGYALPPQLNQEPPLQATQTAAPPPVVFFETMPEPAIQPAAKPPASPAPLTAWIRLPALFLSAVFFASGLTLALGSSEIFSHPMDVLFIQATSIPAIGYSLLFFRVGMCRTRPRFWGFVRWLLIATCLNAAVGAALVFFRWPAESSSQMPRIVPLTVMIFAADFALFFGLLPGGLRRPNEGWLQASRSWLPAGRAGWAVLGAILVALGVTTTIGSTLFARAFTGAEAEEVGNLVENRVHLLVGLSLFLPGLFCLVHSRRDLGVVHLFRGVAGFFFAGLLVFILSEAIQSTLLPGPDGIEFAYVSWAQVMGLFGLGILTALLIFWPARALEVRPR